MMLPAFSTSETAHQTMIYQQQIPLTTKGPGDMHDLSEQVAAIVTASKVQTGTVNIFNVGSTGAVGTIEFEPGLERDLPTLLDKLIPCRQPCSAHRSPYLSRMASWLSVPGSRSFTWNATCARVNEPF